MNKQFLTNNDVKDMVSDILEQMMDDKFIPDFVVGITRGGLMPAVLISQRLSIPMETLKISLTDNFGKESKYWLENMATGYPYGHNIKNILIVDDINDTGKTMETLKNDWETNNKTFFQWKQVWHNNVRFATLVNNEGSTFNTDYTSLRINKVLENTWIEFPWENWWI